MADQDKQNRFFKTNTLPTYQAPPPIVSEPLYIPADRQAQTKPYSLRQNKGWIIKFLTFLFGLGVIGLILEVQPIKILQPSFFLADKQADIENTVLKETTPQKAISEATIAKLTQEVLASKECSTQRDINANLAMQECLAKDQTSFSVCQFNYNTIKNLPCPEMPALDSQPVEKPITTATQKNTQKIEEQFLTEEDGIWLD